MKAWTRENLYVLEDATRHHYRFVMPGAALEETEWQRCLERLSRLRRRRAISWPAAAFHRACRGLLRPGGRVAGSSELASCWTRPNPVLAGLREGGTS